MIGTPLSSYWQEAGADRSIDRGTRQPDAPTCSPCEAGQRGRNCHMLVSQSFDYLALMVLDRVFKVTVVCLGALSVALTVAALFLD